MESTIHIKNYSAGISVAVTPVEQSKGLMFAKTAFPIAFPTKTPEYKKFWMKNTPAPLDIIFCIDNRIIHIANGIPNSTELVGPNQPADLVVELPRGTVKNIGASVGDEINIKYSREDRVRIIREAR